MDTYLLLLTILFGFVKGDGTPTEQDFRVIQHLGKYLSYESLVFVEDRKHAGLVKRIRDLSGDGVYSAVLGSQALGNILATNVSQLKYFKTKTVIMTKEGLNLTALLNKTIVPHLLTWVIFKDYDLYKPVYIPLSSDVLFVHSTPGIVTVRQVYHIKPGFGETVRTVWSWVPDNQTDDNPLALDYLKNNFYNVTINTHYIYYNVCENIIGSLMRVKVECLQSQILDLLARRLNFSVNAVECMEKTHPYTLPNGTESELFVKLRRWEVDFSVVTHVVRINKFDSIDFIWPTVVLKSMMYLKQSRVAGHLTSYLRPLHPSIWWGILFWILLTGVLIAVFENLLQNKFKFDVSLVLDFIDSVLKAFRVFCNQAVEVMPDSISIRILYLLKLFVFLIFFQAYCGYLASSLTVIIPYFPFMDLKGFFENHEFQLMTLRQEFQRFYYRKVVGEGKRKNFMLSDDELPRSIQEGVDKLCSHPHLAFVEFKENLLDSNGFKCTVSEIPSPMANLYMGMASPKNTPYREVTNRQLIHFVSTGLTRRLLSHLTSHSNLDSIKSEDDFLTVSMTEVFSVFIVLAIGICLSLVIFALEVLIAKHKEQNP